MAHRGLQGQGNGIGENLGSSETLGPDRRKASFKLAFAWVMQASLAYLAVATAPNIGRNTPKAKRMG
jgi:hypothetical protein